MSNQPKQQPPKQLALRSIPEAPQKATTKTLTRCFHEQLALPKQSQRKGFESIFEKQIHTSEIKTNRIKARTNDASIQSTCNIRTVDEWNESPRWKPSDWAIAITISSAQTQLELNLATYGIRGIGRSF